MSVVTVLSLNICSGQTVLLLFSRRFLFTILIEKVTFCLKWYRFPVSFFLLEGTLFIGEIFYFCKLVTFWQGDVFL